MKTDVCPSSKYPSLESKFRRIIQNPKKIFSKYVKPGSKVLDIGCGPGFFTLGLAEMVGEEGLVIGTDIQDDAINIINKKIKNTIYEKFVKAVKTNPGTIGISEKMDFILNFYVLHEIKEKEKIINEIKSLMKADSLYALIEPKGHVNGKDFEEEVELIKKAGFELIDTPKVFFSRAAIFKIKE